VFHVELRQFPHNFCRFNLSERELRATVLDAWVRREPVELGERRWDPRQASLIVIEAPRLPLQELSMGRGWRNAERRGSDVTERVLALARAAQRVDAAGTSEGAAGAQPVEGSAPAAGLARAQAGTPSAGAGAAAAQSPAGPARPGAPAAGAELSPAIARGQAPEAASLAAELIALLGDDPVSLMRAWQLALERHPDRVPSECLALAEDLVRR
jgi:hypothetical protein